MTSRVHPDDRGKDSEEVVDGGSVERDHAAQHRHALLVVGIPQPQDREGVAEHRLRKLVGTTQEGRSGGG